MNIDTFFNFFLVKSKEAFNELEKVILNHKPTKTTLILDKSNIPPDMMNTIRNNNAYENEFWSTYNPYKNTLHIDSKPKYTLPYYCPISSVYSIDCFAGSYNPDTNKGAITDCRVCNTGKYSLDIARLID